MQGYRVGDKVRVTGHRGCFTRYEDFFKENNSIRYKPLYQYKSSIQEGEYFVIGIGKHSEDPNYYGPLYLLQSDIGKVYIMNNKYDEIEPLKEKPLYAFEVMAKEIGRAHV